jgi:hypothetical protein
MTESMKNGVFFVGYQRAVSERGALPSQLRCSALVSSRRRFTDKSVVEKLPMFTGMYPNPWLSAGLSEFSPGEM